MLANKELAVELAEEEKHYFIFVQNENKWKHRRMQAEHVPSLSSDKLDSKPFLFLWEESTRARTANRSHFRIVSFVSRALSSTDEEKRETLRSLLRIGQNSPARVKISTQEKEVFLDRARRVVWF